MEYSSRLEQERISRGWSRAYVEGKYGLSQSSLKRWERGVLSPNQASLYLLCQIYGKSAKELGLDKSGDIIGTATTNAPTSQEENPMSDLIRRFALSDLGSYLTGLVSTWPRRNHRYAELQEGINKAIIDHTALAGQDSALNRRQALMSLGLIPIQLIGDRPVNVKKTDADTLLPYCAAGITACWYLRRGKDLIFVSDLISSYISLLQPLTYSQSETHRKAAAGLLAQSFGLKGSLSRSLKNNGAYYDEAIQYALASESPIEQAIANRVKAIDLYDLEEYEQALPYAEKAHGLVTVDTPKIIHSFIASGLALCQGANGQVKEANINLSKALNLFDPTASTTPIPYSEAILTGITADVKQHSGLWQESVNLYEKSLGVPDISVMGSIEGRICCAKVEVSRDDQDRNMDLCVHLLSEAIPTAIELNSKYFVQEAHKCISLLRIAWPREVAVKKLGELF